MDKVSTLKWTGTVLTLLGAISTVMAWTPWNVYAFNVGSVMFLGWAWIIRDRAMIAVNAGLLGIYLIGSLKSML